MDNETLDRLLMDRALGGLSADVEALLAAYLAQVPDAATRAGEFQTAADAARRVLRSDRSTVPQPAVMRWQEVERTRRRLRMLRQGLWAAAILILGVGLGLMWPRTDYHSGTLGASATARNEAALPPERRLIGDFWSAPRLYQQARRAAVPTHTRLIWHSAVNRPQVGGAL